MMNPQTPFNHSIPKKKNNRIGFVVRKFSESPTFEGGKVRQFWV